MFALRSRAFAAFLSVARLLLLLLHQRRYRQLIVERQHLHHHLAWPWVWRGEELRHAGLQLPFVAVVRTDVKPHNVIRSADGEGANLAVYPRRPILADGLEMHRSVLWISEPQAKLLPCLLANGRRELGKLLTKGAGRGGLHREQWCSRPPTRAGHRPPFGRKRRI